MKISHDEIKAYLKPKHITWDRELYYATQRPEIWKSFALELYLSADFLYEGMQNAFSEEYKGDYKIKRYFNASKFIRMLWGYSLENLAKGILLNTDNENKYINSAKSKIKWDKNGHNLSWLFNELDYKPKIDLDEKSEKAINNIQDYVDQCIDAWSESALWYGKYPFPNGVNGVLDEYKALTREGLYKRVQKGKRKYILSDKVRSCLNDFERDVFEKVYSDLKNKIEELING